jgi:hypothetical protein
MVCFAEDMSLDTEKLIFVKNDQVSNDECALFSDSSLTREPRGCFPLVIYWCSFAVVVTPLPFSLSLVAPRNPSLAMD